MFGKALEYPTESDNLVREYGIAVLLTLGSIFILPFFMLLGYYTKAIRQTLEGDGQIPEFDDFTGLLIDGIKLFGIIAVYLGIPVIVSSVLETIGLTGTVSIVAATVIVLLLIAGIYILPSAIVNFARNNRMMSGFNLKEVGRKAFTARYLKGFLVLIITSTLISLVQSAVILVLILTIIGIPALLIVLPAIKFYENLVYMRIMSEMAE